jgi:hypothetical protein
MKHSIPAVLLLILFGIGFVATAAEPVAKKLQAKDAATQGQTIQLQPGVKVTQPAKNRARASIGQISGSFECECDASGSGSCTMVFAGDHISCFKGQGDSCSSECRMSTKIKGGLKTKIVK